MLFSGASAAGSGFSEDVDAKLSGSEGRHQTINGYAALEAYHLVQEVVRNSVPSQEKIIEAVELRILAQEEKIRSLEREISRLNSAGAINTSSVVLAAVSVIITVLGVLIAILSIFGYKNIKSESVKSSREAAMNAISEVARNGLKEATEKSIVDLIEDGRFDKIITNAVANIAYRGISMPDGLAEENQE